jgi:hypothetical protein
MKCWYLLLEYRHSLVVFTCSAADIIGPRNIRASRDQSFCLKWIMRLLFEFSDSNVPVILGQWIEELGSLKMAPRHRFTELKA